MRWEYLLAIQIACGCFAAFLAARQGQSRPAWFAVGALLPVVGVLLALWATRTRPARAEAGRPGASGKEAKGRARGRRPPRRCRGSYIPDCVGCPHFRASPLFDPSLQDSRKGYCELFGKPLVDEETSGVGQPK